jgi:hypothetical protein
MDYAMLLRQGLFNESWRYYTQWFWTTIDNLENENNQ